MLGDGFRTVDGVAVRQSYHPITFDNLITSNNLLTSNNLGFTSQRWFTGQERVLLTALPGHIVSFIFSCGPFFFLSFSFLSFFFLSFLNISYFFIS